MMETPASAPAGAPAAGSRPNASNLDVKKADVRELVKSQWCAALNVPDISGEDDFFELGGHSLAALTVMTAIEQALDVELDGMRDIWEHSTLDAFAARVAALAGG
jgi:phthiocerol/phenolphthiocerol synthesis type-I polyketide synthase E